MPYLIYSGASNHMVASGESFTTLTLSGGPDTDMGCDFQIPAAGRGSIKIRNDEFKNVLNVPSSAAKKVVQYEEEAESSIQWIRIDESLLGVTPSPVAQEVYEISNIWSSHMVDPEEDIQISIIEEKISFHSSKHSLVILLF